MKVRFLTVEEIDAEYDRLRPVFERVPTAADYTHDDILRLAKSGAMVVGYAEEDGEVLAVMAFEFLHYVRINAVNIVALAGTRLDEIHAQFFEAFREFCRLADVTAIEARCGEGMARLLQRYGFSRTYHIVSCKV
ncbi:hypothetical protein [Ensifer sp. SSB1]|uniref:hypothetical protein n=1 Tax=Ensifer sp. SSB1 TaxID=2795385 RepID=UPI001A48A9E8|nr:hypothetical protein [Ensifer sp. SSB1]MBK5570096.1 hypothetical protein [Ensifer sp. SSB1]